MHQFLSLFMADTLTLLSFLSHHPLYLIYLLLSFPYLLPILSFLYPLLLSTSILLLLITTTSPLSHHYYPHSLLALLAVLKQHDLDDKDPSAGGLMVIANELLQALLGDPETMQLRCLSGPVERAGRRVMKQRSMSVGGRKELGGPEVLQRDGSMRKEKEWKRTLACKLYEERITFKLFDETKVADKGEEMDLLWEAYEYDIGCSKNSKGNKYGDRMSIVEQQQQQDKRSEVNDDDDDDEKVVGRLCCLQALRMSTRKMSLRGVGATNLVKVLKGIGLFHSVGGSRRGGRSRNEL